MFSVHAQRKRWETAEELEAISVRIEDNPEMSDSELAAELGMKTGTFREHRSDDIRPGRRASVLPAP